MRVALQLHTIAPSSPLSHSASDLQLPEFFISLQSLAPMQAHLTPSPGVWKQLNSALASILLESDADVIGCFIDSQLQPAAGLCECHVLACCFEKLFE